MRSVETRLSKLEQRLIPQSLAGHGHPVLPEMRAFFNELAPMLERSEVLPKIVAEGNRVGCTLANRIAFWSAMRELLLPHPELYQRLADLLDKQIKLNETVNAESRGRGLPWNPVQAW